MTSKYNSDFGNGVVIFADDFVEDGPLGISLWWLSIDQP